MSFEKNELYMRGLKALHFLLTIFSFAAGWFLFRYDSIYLDLSAVGFRYNWYTVALYALLLLFFLRTYNAYVLGYFRVRTLVLAQFLSQLFSTGIVFFSTAFAWSRFLSPVWLFVMLVWDFFVDIAWSFFTNSFFFRFNPQRKAVFLYRTSRDLHRLHQLTGKPMERLYKIENEFCCEGMVFQDIIPYMDDFDAVFVAGLEPSCRNGIIKYCTETGKYGFFFPNLGDILMKGAEHMQSFSSPVLFTEGKRKRPEYLFIKRAFDIVASALGILVFSPLMSLVAIAIKAYDRGPAIYRQIRLTENGREFVVYKFRSMRVDAEKDGKARLSMGEDDVRITPIGKIIRKCRLDELPQLFNILKGDMSFVGPRPERPEIAEEYYKELPEFRFRLQMKAGLTGYAQVYGKYNTEPYEKLEFDLMYLNNMSVLTDLKILFATFEILFNSESTEGIGKGQITAVEYDFLTKD